MENYRNMYLADQKKLKEVLQSLEQYLRDLDIDSSGGPETVIYTRMGKIIADLKKYMEYSGVTYKSGYDHDTGIGHYEIHDYSTDDWE